MSTTCQKRTALHLLSLCPIWGSNFVTQRSSRQEVNSRCAAFRLPMFHVSRARARLNSVKAEPHTEFDAYCTQNLGQSNIHKVPPLSSDSAILRALAMPLQTRKRIISHDHSPAAVHSLGFKICNSHRRPIRLRCAIELTRSFQFSSSFKQLNWNQPGSSDGHRDGACTELSLWHIYVAISKSKGLWR